MSRHQHLEPGIEAGILAPIWFDVTWVSWGQGGSEATVRVHHSKVSFPDDCWLLGFWIISWCGSLWRQSIMLMPSYLAQCAAQLVEQPETCPRLGSEVQRLQWRIHYVKCIRHRRIGESTSQETNGLMPWRWTLIKCECSLKFNQSDISRSLSFLLSKSKMKRGLFEGILPDKLKHLQHSTHSTSVWWHKDAQGQVDGLSQMSGNHNLAYKKP